MVEPHTSIPERFVEGLRLLALAEDGQRRELEVEGVWPHKGRLVLKFRGVESISEAEALVGCELQVPRDQRTELEPGWTYVSDLTGCTVWDGGREIGTIAGVQFGTGEAPVLVIRRGQEEFLVPFATEFLETVDAASQQVRMRLPEGMLTINAPLTAEEKAQQASGRGKKKAPG